jgi:hypothetical protein
MRCTRPTLVAIAVACVVLCAACDTAPETDHSPSAQPPPTAAVTTQPPTEAEVEDWIAFRTAYGLRADRPWVVSVAADAASENDTGVPLLPAELAELGALNLRQSDLIPAMKAYGKTRERVYAGTIVDGNQVVLQVVGPVAPHEAALKLILGTQDGWEVRSVRWSLDELTSFVETVEASRPWFEARDMLVPGPTIDEGNNAVLVDYFARVEGVGQQLADHLGKPPWLELRYGGPPPSTGPRGRLQVKAVDASGRPVEGLFCEAIPLDPTVNADTGESFNTNSKGICTQRHLPAAAYRIVVNRLDKGEPIPVGETRATVHADSWTRVTIEVHP